MVERDPLPNWTEFKSIDSGEPSSKGRIRRKNSGQGMPLSTAEAVDATFARGTVDGALTPDEVSFVRRVLEQKASPATKPRPASTLHRKMQSGGV